MGEIAALKTQKDDFEVEYEVLSPIDLDSIIDPGRQEIAFAIQALDEQIKLCNDHVSELNADIDKLTNHADGFDYAIAVASGIFSGILDSFLVGDYNPDIEEVVTEFAKRKAKSEEGTIDNYSEARKWLEDKYHTDHDGAFNRGDIFGQNTGSNPHTHRLDDLAHHPTLLGLAASIFFQFFRVAVFANKNGKLHPVFVKAEPEELIKVWSPVVISGILIWLANIAEKYCQEELEEDVPAPIRKLIKLIAATPVIIRVLKCADVWFGHIMSDVGPREDGREGKGIPGLFLSLLKEISMLPILKGTNLPSEIQKLYSSGKFNFDSELVMVAKLKRQAIPVIINEVIVRSFYFVRRLISEYKRCETFKSVDWSQVLPIGNRTVERMMTIASGTFTAVDIADAAIRSGGFNAACLLRVNFVGVGRFAVAISVDVGMGVKRSKLRDERIAVMSHQLALLNAKVYYRYAELYYTQADMYEQQEKMWISAGDAVATLNEAYEVTEEVIEYYKTALCEINDNLERISTYVESMEQHNPGLKDDINNILKWGQR